MKLNNLIMARSDPGLYCQTVRAFLLFGDKGFKVAFQVTLFFIHYDIIASIEKQNKNQIFRRRIL